MDYEGLSTEWPIDVGRRFDEYAGGRTPAVDDLWVTSGALLARYRLQDRRMAL